MVAGGDDGRGWGEEPPPAIRTFNSSCDKSHILYSNGLDDLGGALMAHKYEAFQYHRPATILTLTVGLI